MIYKFSSVHSRVCMFVSVRVCVFVRVCEHIDVSYIAFIHQMHIYTKCIHDIYIYF